MIRGANFRQGPRHTVTRALEPDRRKPIAFGTRALEQGAEIILGEISNDTALLRSMEVDGLRPETLELICQLKAYARNRDQYDSDYPELYSGLCDKLEKLEEQQYALVEKYLGDDFTAFSNDKIYAFPTT